MRFFIGPDSRLEGKLQLVCLKRSQDLQRSFRRPSAVLVVPIFLNPITNFELSFLLIFRSYPPLVFGLYSQLYISLPLILKIFSVFRSYNSFRVLLPVVFDILLPFICWSCVYFYISIPFFSNLILVVF